MSSININEPIILDDGEYTFLEQSGPMIRLRSSATGEDVVLTHARLAERIVGLPPVLLQNVERLASYEGARRDQLDDLAAHLNEIVTGKKSEDAITRPEYDLALTTQEQRVQAKIVELAGTSLEIKRSALMVKLGAFKKGGPSALIDGRAFRAVKKHVSEPDPVVDALQLVMSGQRLESTGTKKRLMNLLALELTKQFGHSRAEALMPSTSTLYRLIEELDAGRHTTGSAKTRRSLAGRPNGIFSQNVETFAGAEVQLDSTPLDVLVTIPGYKGPQRPILTIMLDVASRSILAFTFRAEAAKGVDHSLLLLRALTPHENRPDFSGLRAKFQLRHPSVTLLSAEELRHHESRRPFLYPRNIVIDNGNDFRGTTMSGTARAFGMSVRLSPPHTPTTKSHVERTFGSIKTLFAENLPGYTGGSVENRGHKIEKQPLLDIYTLQELFRDWVTRAWQNRPHTGLRDPLNRSKLFTPNQAAAATTELLATLEIPLSTADFIRALDRDTRSITDKGVAVNTWQYDSPELDILRNTKSKTPRDKGLWEIRIDPYNPGCIWVLGRKGEYIQCTARDKDMFDTPFAEDLTIGAEPTPRGAVAYVNSQIEGLPLHQLPPTLLAPMPSDFDDDDDDDDFELPSFDPESI